MMIIMRLSSGSGQGKEWRVYEMPGSQTRVVREPEREEKMQLLLIFQKVQWNLTAIYPR